MKDSIMPYQNSPLSKKEQVGKMFDDISGSYDRLNRIITFGTDIGWRKKVLKIVEQCQPETIIDIATGTGDLAILLAKSKATKIIGLDISAGMLEIGKKKVEEKQLSHRIQLMLADSENLPFCEDYADAVTVAFGIRNFENLEKGLAEILRVLKPNGVFVILETSVPNNVLYKGGYKIYTHYVLPFLGRLFSGNKVAYGYLSESSAVFPHGEALNQILRKVGFGDVVSMPQTMGVATIYKAYKK